MRLAYRRHKRPQWHGLNVAPDRSQSCQARRERHLRKYVQERFLARSTRPNGDVVRVLVTSLDRDRRHMVVVEDRRLGDLLEPEQDLERLRIVCLLDASMADLS